jgi:diguanylate cyclase (GGDEF)-like protein
MAAVTILLIALLAGTVFSTAQRYRTDQRWTLHSYQVREQVLQLVNHVHVAEMEARSYGLTGRDVALRQYWQAIGASENDAKALASLVADNPRQAASVRQLTAAINARRTQFERILDDYRTRGVSVAHADVVALISQSQQPVRDTADEILAREAGLLDARSAASARNGRAVTLAAAIALGASIALLLLAFVSTGVEQRRRLHSEHALTQSADELQHALADANRASQTLRRLSTLAELLQNCRDMGEAVGVIERALPPLLPDTSGALAMLNASRNTVEACMHWGARGPELGDAVFAPDACWALRRSQPHPGIEDHTAPPCPHLVEAGVTAAHTLCLPLNAQGTAFGVLTLCATAPLAPATQQLAATAADQLALALGNLQLQASLRTQSIRDPLTGLFNRRYLEASMPRELLRAERRQGALSVLAFDIDHFKRYNDTQGHDAGDALLGAFGALLAQSCRGEDIPCRYGGEEFTLILTEANHSQALARAEAIRKATSELVVHYRAGTLPPATVSIGVATYPEHGATPETLLRLADQALYRAKHLGRNTIASANDLESVVNAPASAAHP